MASRGGSIKNKGLLTAVTAAKNTTPIHQQFALDVMHAIEEHDIKTRKKSSNYYTPSSMSCQRNMYYKRVEAPTDDTRSGYQIIGMSATGTGRHENIQEVLEAMQKYGLPWKYWDVEEWLKMHRWPYDKCKNLVVVAKHGGETLIRDDVLKLSFKCDGIVEYLKPVPDPFYLFEFKNQISFSASNKRAVDEKHYSQVRTYCLEFELSHALVTYENRDNCALIVPETFIVTEEDKQKQLSFILDTEGYVERKIVPPCPPKTQKLCQYCKYKGQCMRDK